MSENIGNLTVEHKAEEYDRLMCMVKYEISHSGTHKQTQLLTLDPQNCSREAVSKYFGTSLYLVDLRELLKNRGIFGEVERKNGKLKDYMIHLLIFIWFNECNLY